MTRPHRAGARAGRFDGGADMCCGRTPAGGSPLRCGSDSASPERTRAARDVRMPRLVSRARGRREASREKIQNSVVLYLYL